jgi:release factor glutamine methyltransferase
VPRFPRPARGLALVRAARLGLKRSQGRRFPIFVDICGWRFEVHKGVCPPDRYDATEFAARAIPFERGWRFAEVGSGTGVISVVAALRGARSVVATDVNPAAIVNTQANAQRHAVQPRVRAYVGDILECVPTHQRFNAIFWNFPWIGIRLNNRCPTVLERALFDPEYEALERFLRTVRNYLACQGRVFLGFGNTGRRQLLNRLCRKYGWRSWPVAVGRSTRDPRYTYELLELLPICATGNSAERPKSQARTRKLKPIRK